jgi:hypothetical protein
MSRLGVQPELLDEAVGNSRTRPFEGFESVRRGPITDLGQIPLVLDEV